MKFYLSKEYLGYAFAQDGVTKITFDIYLSTGTATVQGPAGNTDDMQITSTSSSDVTVSGTTTTYHKYTVTIDETYYVEKLLNIKTEYIQFRYTGGGASSFFYVDNLAAK